MKALLDENLPPALARALNCFAEAEGHEVVHVYEIVPRGTKDVDLFKAIAAKAIQIHITQDHHHRKAIERDAIAGAGLIVFVLSKSWASQELYEKAARLIRWWPHIISFAERISPPAMFRVPWPLQGGGKFEQIRIVK